MRYTLLALIVAGLAGPLACADPRTPDPGNGRHRKPAGMDRRALVERHNPVLTRLDPTSPFTLGNGRFAFTADITGLQSLPDLYYRDGIPLETKARWAWHSRANPGHFRLRDALESYVAYGRMVQFPTNMDSAAGQWLRSNPHDLPLARAGVILDGEPIRKQQITAINQRLDLWRGVLRSDYVLESEPVSVRTAVDPHRDLIVMEMRSALLANQRVGLSIRFPRGYDLAMKNTPDLIWGPANEHVSTVLREDPNSIAFRRVVDDAEHFVRLAWSGEATIEPNGEHRYRLVPAAGTKLLQVSIEFSRAQAELADGLSFDDVVSSSASAWREFWLSGAAIDFSGSTDPRAFELERRVVLSRYLMAAQSRAEIPTQETGLTSSSWYGKLHTEMSWWHTAHWALWGQPQNVERVLDWYVEHLESARQVAHRRGLRGARWAKMVGPDNRESPGGNALIIWNQPQPIHLAEMVYRADPKDVVLHRYSKLVEETANAMASMLVWDAIAGQFSLDAPIWIAQELYDPRSTRNPSFELAYWRHGLKVAQRWRQRRGLSSNTQWQRILERLAPLPHKDGKYVAIESRPDTWDNIESRQDHPTVLAPLGLLDDDTVDEQMMRDTLFAVLANWDWEKRIWGWDYPMIAMTATRLRDPETAIDVLLSKAPHNDYLPNGHCPQQGANLPVYLPANGALLAVVAMMAAGWEGSPDRPTPGFPDDARWQVRAEGFAPKSPEPDSASP